MSKHIAFTGGSLDGQTREVETQSLRYPLIYVSCAPHNPDDLVDPDRPGIIWKAPKEFYELTQWRSEDGKLEYLYLYRNTVHYKPEPT